MKKILHSYKNLIKGFLIIFLALVTMLSSMVTGNVVFANNGAMNFELTDPLVDLKQDETFDIKNYPYDENGQVEIYTLTEYCYSFYREKSANFGLYVYVYNPQGLAFKDTSLNRIQMAVGYNEQGEPNDYKKYELKFCSKSSADSGAYGLFYKYKVVDDGSIYDRLISTERRYDVSGVELVTTGSLNATDIGVKKTFIYTGFSAGYGPNGQIESTLRCDYKILETVSLDVQHTYWRSKSSNRGVGYQNQLDSVYFTVPNELLEYYGKLQRIKAEWYEYLTKDIVVTSNEEVYYAIKNYLGKTDLSGLEYSLVENFVNRNDIYYADWGFCSSSNVPVYCQDYLDVLYYLFPTTNWCDITEYDPYGDITSTGGVSGNVLYDYILNYSKNASSNTLAIKDDLISADLFESDIEDYRKTDNEHGKIQNGYSYYDFDADVDILDWQAYDPDDHKYKENKKLYGWWKALWGNYSKFDEGFDAENVTPILLLEDEDLSGNATEISDRLFVNYNDVEKIKAVYEEAKKNNETVVLFRFALTDYYCSNLSTVSYSGIFPVAVEDEAYRAKQSVFFDFDIIQLTFSKDEVLTVVPAVSNPIDIVNDITSPMIVSGPAWWETLLAYVITIIASILGVAFVVGIYMALLKIYTGSANLVGKILLTIPIVVVLVLVLVYALPWVISTVNGFGGL